jgi:hypothetical protein
MRLQCVCMCWGGGNIYEPTRNGKKMYNEGLHCLHCGLLLLIVRNATRVEAARKHGPNNCRLCSCEVWRHVRFGEICCLCFHFSTYPATHMASYTRIPSYQPTPVRISNVTKTANFETLTQIEILKRISRRNVRFYTRLQGSRSPLILQDENDSGN